MVRGSPCMCMRHTPTLARAAHSRAPGARSARHVVDDAGARLHRGRHDLELAGIDGDGHIESGRDALDHRHHPRALGGGIDAEAPGRVDSPPTSMMAAPSATICAARSSAALELARSGRRRKTNRG